MFTNTKTALNEKKDFTDVDLLVLLCVFRRMSQRKIAKELGKSPGIAQFHVKWLDKHKFIYRTGDGWSNYAPTAKGLEVLKKNGQLNKFPQNGS